MKTHTKLLRLIIQGGYLFTIAFFSLLFLSCEDDDDILDDRVPTIQVEGVANDEIKETTLSTEGFPLNMIIADNSGLLNYTVDVDSASVNVLSFQSSDLKYKLEHETIMLDDIAVNYLYDIKIVVEDINSNTSTFQFKLRINDFKKYDYLGLVGDATLAGWNPAASEAMTKDDVDPALFTYVGPLMASGEGAFKIAAYSGDWCDGDWLFASEANKSITEKDKYVINDCGGPDNKWQVTGATEGNYLITVNLRNKTIKFEFQ